MLHKKNINLKYSNTTRTYHLYYNCQKQMTVKSGEILLRMLQLISLSHTFHKSTFICYSK